MAPEQDLYYRRLTFRNTWLMLAVFITPFLLTFLIISQQTSSHLERQVYDRLSDTIEENTKTIRIFLQEREIDLRSLSHFEIDSIGEIDRYASIFQTFIREKEWYDFILTADLEGEVIMTINTDIRANIAGRRYFQEARAGRAFNTGIFLSDIMNRPLLILANPLRGRNGRIIGVTAAALGLERFYNLLFDLTLGETSELFLIDDSGLMLSPTKLGGRPLQDFAFDSHYSNPHVGESGILTHFDYRGKKVLCAYRRIAEINAYLVSEIDLEEALRPVSRVTRLVLWIVLPFILIFLLLSNLSSRRITSLMRSLTRDLEKALQDMRNKKKEVEIINRELQLKIQESDQLTLDLKLSEEYIRNLIDSISLGVIGLERSGAVTHCNREMQNIIGRDLCREGISLFSISPWFDDPEIRQAFIRTLDTRRPERIAEKTVDRGKGEEYFSYSFFPIESDSGDILDVTLAVENITDRRRMREQLAEYEKLSALSQLAMGAAHEINNPLLGISSYLEILADSTEDRDTRNEIALVLENVYRISETIRGLLNFARPTPPQFTNIQINHLIEETLSFLSHQPIFRRIKMEKHLPVSLPQVTADLNQIRQVLINIFINAAQSMEKGGRLRVETSKIKFKDMVRIDISDTGSGISEENLKKIFHPFFTTKKNQGTGLGLSISQRLVRNHSGRISVSSRPGEGTIFSIFLPIRQKGRAPAGDEDTIT
jgi:PAS domain S-box-containing protein